MAERHFIGRLNSASERVVDCVCQERWHWEFVEVPNDAEERVQDKCREWKASEYVEECLEHWTTLSCTRERCLTVGFTRAATA